jgi:hypothetical protein
MTAHHHCIGGRAARAKTGMCRLSCRIPCSDSSSAMADLWRWWPLPTVAAFTQQWDDTLPRQLYLNSAPESARLPVRIDLGEQG